LERALKRRRSILKLQVKKNQKLRGTKDKKRVVFLSRQEAGRKLFKKERLQGADNGQTAI